MIHIVKGFSIVNEAEVDVLLEFSCFFYDPTDVGYSISGFSTFSKSSLYIWKFLVHILLKSSLGILSTALLAKHVKWVQLCSNLNILWHSPWLLLGWTLIFSRHVTNAEFSKFAVILHAAFSQHHLLGFEIAQTGIPSPPLALFVVMLPKAHLTSHFRMSGSRWVITPSFLSGYEDLFCVVFLCIVAISS